MSDGASGENVHDWDTAMSYGSTDSDEPEDFGDEESVPENWELYSMGADGRYYVFLSEPFVVVPTISSRTLEYHEQLLEASYEFMAYYQGEHLRGWDVSGTTFRAGTCCRLCRFGLYGRIGRMSQANRATCSIDTQVSRLCMAWTRCRQVVCFRVARTRRGTL
eukprot:scaffold15278_cov37-Attheya_sp.AAC.4